MNEGSSADFLLLLASRFPPLVARIKILGRKVVIVQYNVHQNRRAKGKLL